MLGGVKAPGNSTTLPSSNLGALFGGGKLEAAACLVGKLPFFPGAALVELAFVTALVGWS